jgi:photosystem II stability/assembly factor-like uncharacterized protein
MGAGLYRSVDGGVNWYSTNLTSQDIFAIQNDPFSSYVYAGCVVNGTFYRSVDGGVTWFQNDTGINGLVVYTIAVDPTTPGVVYVGTNTGIFRSVNFGVDWAPFGLPGSLVLSFRIRKNR